MSLQARRRLRHGAIKMEGGEETGVDIRSVKYSRKQTRDMDFDIRTLP